MKTHPSLTSRVCAGWPSVRLAFAAPRLFLHPRHARPVHLHIPDRNRLAHHHRQVPLNRLLNLLPLSPGDILSDGLGVALHRLGGHLQTGEEFHPLASVIEGSLLAHHSLHAAHTGRELRVLNVQFDIGGELALRAVRTQIVGPRYSDCAHHREDGLGPQFPVLGQLTTRARQPTLIRRGASYCSNSFKPEAPA